MRTVIQRVSRGRVAVVDSEDHSEAHSETVGEIGRGAVLLVGVEEGDSETDADATAEKIAKMRFFPGATPMDRTLLDVGGACLVISQFTLAADLRKGNRPGFTRAMDPAIAEGLYLRVAEKLSTLGVTIATGTFGAKMEVELVNDGPVTFVLQTRDGRVV